MLTYKSLKFLVTRQFIELFTKCSESYGLNLCSSEANFEIPLLRTSIGQNVYCYRGAKVWNELSRKANLAPPLKTSRSPSY